MAEGTVAGAGSLPATVTSLMPRLESDLARPVAILSISASNYSEATHPHLGLDLFASGGGG
jgi:hypothetical protein